MDLQDKEITQQASARLTALGNTGASQKQRFIADVLTAAPDAIYSPGDYSTIRKLIFRNVQNAINKRFPLTNQKYSLGIQNVQYTDPQDVPIDQQKQAILQNKSLGRRIKGQWVLRDNATNKVVSRTKPLTLMKVPYMTDRGTFIQSGSQFTFNNIMRLQPGVYTKKTNADQIDAQFNVKRGTGAGFNMHFTPSTGIFYISKGTRNVPAYYIMHQIGVSDQDMQKSWGKELFQKNKTAGTTDRARLAATALYNS